MSRPSDGAILHVNRVGFLGGVERVILTLAAGMEAHGFGSVLACPDGGELARAARAASVPVAPCPLDRMRITANPFVAARYPLAWRAGARAILRICREQRVGLIHAHHPVGVLYAAPAARSLGLPILLHLHEVLPAKPLYALALRRAVRVADRCICVSEAGRRLAETAQAPASRVAVIHNGVDPALLAAGPPVPAPEVAGPGPHIGVFGVIEPRKGQHIFLEAAALLAARFPTARFWIVGAPALADKAGYARRLARAADAGPLAGRVTFTGHRTDVARWMQAMDVVTLPSVAHESLSMALLEALTLGRPTVGTRVGGAAEAIHDGETGLLVPPGDAATLAAAVAAMLEGAGARLGPRAASDARARFAADGFCRRVAATYAEILHRDHRSAA